MKMGSVYPALMVALREATVARLMALRYTPDECIADVVDRMLPAPTPALPASPTTEDTQQTSVAPQGKYTCDVLDTRVHASTLGSLFGAVVDLMDTVAPDALLRLSEKRTTKRRHLSRDRAGVHLGTRYLPVLRTRSARIICGFWTTTQLWRTDFATARRRRRMLTTTAPLPTRKAAWLIANAGSPTW